MADSLLRLYQLYKPCVVRITVTDDGGDLHSGTGFHIGEGYIVTAKHVVNSGELEEVVAHHYGPGEVSVRRIHYPSEEGVDLAVLQTDFSLDHYMSRVTIMDGQTPREKADAVPLGGHLDDWLGDELLMSKALLMGFLRIPLADRMDLVAVEARVNAVVDKCTGGHPHFIVSSVPRGGFSGGPAISEYGFLLGVVTESLLEKGQDLTAGFTSVVSIEPLLVLLDEHKIYPGENGKLIRELFHGEEAGQEPGDEAP